eukprot:TRINITY_DN34208_c0_g1_i1.p1 TRINITY_DN34208_c0_g1~~TRINITY_DN34208_c0_g1_i1.p1  ORF type:complete len:244 (-),score=59.24 TRINITY_DN34208_c0_g1_i1:197-928(-)
MCVSARAARRSFLRLWLLATGLVGSLHCAAGQEELPQTVNDLREATAQKIDELKAESDRQIQEAKVNLQKEVEAEKKKMKEELRRELEKYLSDLTQSPSVLSASEVDFATANGRPPVCTAEQCESVCRTHFDDGDDKSATIDLHGPTFIFVAVAVAGLLTVPWIGVWFVVRRRDQDLQQIDQYKSLFGQVNSDRNRLFDHLERVSRGDLCNDLIAPQRPAEPFALEPDRAALPSNSTMQPLLG